MGVRSVCCWNVAEENEICQGCSFLQFLNCSVSPKNELIKDYGIFTIDLYLWKWKFLAALQKVYEQKQHPNIAYNRAAVQMIIGHFSMENLTYFNTNFHL